MLIDQTEPFSDLILISVILSVIFDLMNFLHFECEKKKI